MPSCIICHLKIVKGKDILCKCPNGHSIHEDCLKEWLLYSLKCPLCHDDYSSDLIAKYKDYLNQKAIEKEKILEDELKQEKRQKIENVADKMVFLKYIVKIEDLIEKKEYIIGLEKLELFDKRKLSTYKSHTILFLKGKIHYLKGHYDIAIANLFKLVKEKFDYPEAFLYLGKSYERIGLKEKADWAFARVKSK